MLTWLGGPCLCFQTTPPSPRSAGGGGWWTTGTSSWLTRHTSCTTPPRPGGSSGSEYPSQDLPGPPQAAWSGPGKLRVPPNAGAAPRGPPAETWFTGSWFFSQQPLVIWIHQRSYGKINELHEEGSRCGAAAGVWINSCASLLIAQLRMTPEGEKGRSVLHPPPPVHKSVF